MNIRPLLISKALLVVLTSSIVGASAYGQPKGEAPLFVSLGFSHLAVGKDSLTAVNSFNIRSATPRETLAVVDDTAFRGGELKMAVGNDEIPRVSRSFAEQSPIRLGYVESFSGAGGSFESRAVSGTVVSSMPTTLGRTSALSGPVTNSVPEPSSWVAVFSGAAMLALRLRRRVA